MTLLNTPVRQAQLAEKEAEARLRAALEAEREQFSKQNAELELAKKQSEEEFGKQVSAPEATPRTLLIMGHCSWEACKSSSRPNAND